jgi:hypothetical protein
MSVEQRSTPGGGSMPSVEQQIERLAILLADDV